MTFDVPANAGLANSGLAKPGLADVDPASGAPPEIRSRLALVLDTDDLVDALRLARELKPWFGVAKVGLELFSAAGPPAVNRLIDLGYDVFVDLKMFDIPTTVEKAARVVGSLGARYLTLHARDDAPMLRAGADGFREGAARAGLDTPIPLAVTVLTSDSGAPPHILPRRVALAVEAGCCGVVWRRSGPVAAGSCAPPRTCGPPARSRPGWSRSFPASGPTGRPPTTRPAPRPR